MKTIKNTLPITSTFLSALLLFVLLSVTQDANAQRNKRKNNKAKATTEKAIEAAEDVALSPESITLELPFYEVQNAATVIWEDERPAYVIIIPNQKIDDVQKDWKKWLKGQKGDVEQEGYHSAATNVRIDELSDERLNVYAKFTPVGDNDIELATAFLQADGAYIDAAVDDGRAEIISRKLNNFARSYDEEIAKDQLNAEKDLLKDYEKDLRKTDKNIDDWRKDIEDAKARIAEREREIEEGLILKAEQEQFIEKQMKQVDLAKKQLDLFNDK